QVIAHYARDRARLKAREAGDAVVLVDDEVARAKFGERAQRAPAPPHAAAVDASRGRAPAAHQAVLGDHREFQRRRDEALAQGRGDERERARRGLDFARRTPLEPARLEVPEVVCRALAFAAAWKR